MKAKNDANYKAKFSTISILKDEKKYHNKNSKTKKRKRKKCKMLWIIIVIHSAMSVG